MLLVTSNVVARNTDEDPKTRRHPIPLYDDRYDWWTQAVRRQLGVVGIDQRRLALELGATEAAVSRCINRDTPTYELLIQISDFLKVAYPVVLPESEEQAIEIAKEKRLSKRVAKAGEIKAGVPETAKKDQTERLVSEHAIRSRKAPPPKGRSSGNARRTP